MSTEVKFRDSIVTHHLSIADIVLLNERNVNSAWSSDMTTASDVQEKYEKYVVKSCVKKIEPVVLVEGKGATVKDIDGNEYLDCFSGISVVNAGHANPKIVAAIKDQADKLLHVCSYVYYSVPMAELAETLAKMNPWGLQKTFFGNSGAEAIECGLKLGRKFSKKHEIVALMCSFHGRTLGTLSVTGQRIRKKHDMGPYLGEVFFAPAPYCYRCPLGLEYPDCSVRCATFVEDLLEYATTGDVAELIAEPILGEGGIIVPPQNYFTTLMKVLKQNGILFIDDEVQTGFGRTGRMFGIEHYDIKPDIVCMAKGIANGLPLGACLTRPDIGDAFEPGDHLSTFGGNPISCAAANANIEYLLKEDLSGQAAKKGNTLMKRLNELKQKFKLIGEVRGKGLMIGVELVRDQRTKTPASDEAAQIRGLCLKRKVLIGHGGIKGNVLRIQPPLVITDREIDTLVSTIETSLKEVTK
jgi:4-aminobutyrate aminotransferase